MAKHKWKKTCMKASEYNNSTVRGLRLLQKHWHFPWNAWGDTRCNGFDRKPQQLRWTVDVTQLRYHLKQNLFSTALSSLFLLVFPPSIPPICPFSHIYFVINFFSISSFLLTWTLFLFFYSHHFILLFWSPWSTSINTYDTFNLHQLLFPSFALSAFMQLHQLRRHMSATAIMPSEGTTEDGEGDWTGDRRRVLGAEPSEVQWRKEGAVIQSRMTWINGVQWNSSMRHFVLFCIKPQRGGTT